MVPSRLRWAHRLAPLVPALAVAALQRHSRWDLEALATVAGVALAAQAAHRFLGAPYLRWLQRRGKLTLTWTLLGGAVIGALVWVALVAAFVAWVDLARVPEFLERSGLSLAASGALAGALAALAFALVAGLPLHRSPSSGADVDAA